MRRVTFYLAFVFLFVVVAPASAFDHQHQLWTSELEKYVHWQRSGVDSQVDYTRWQLHRGGLSSYLAQLSAVSQDEYAAWQREQKLAFLINAYNAFTIDLILQHYPKIDSIKQIGGWFRSPWRLKFFRLLGRSMSLDEVEHSFLRQQGVFDDPRSHFAIVCASLSCPPLSDQAYRPQNIDAQLEIATRRFLSDVQRNRYDAQQNRFFVSKIFKWFEDDFIGYKGGEDLLDFFSQYQSSFSRQWPYAKVASQRVATIEFLPYDWNLNDWQGGHDAGADE